MSLASDKQRPKAWPFLKANAHVRRWWPGKDSRLTTSCGQRRHTAASTDLQVTRLPHLFSARWWWHWCLESCWETVMDSVFAQIWGLNISRSSLVSSILRCMLGTDKYRLGTSSCVCLWELGSYHAQSFYPSYRYSTSNDMAKPLETCACKLPMIRGHFCMELPFLNRTSQSQRHQHQGHQSQIRTATGICYDVLWHDSEQF